MSKTGVEVTSYRTKRARQSKYEMTVNPLLPSKAQEIILSDGLLFLFFIFFIFKIVFEDILIKSNFV